MPTDQYSPPAASSLEIATKLARPQRGAWVLTLYPTAAEAVATFSVTTRAPRCATPGPALDPDRSAVEAARRARVTLRRYAVANRLDRLGTLTFRGDGCHDERALRGHMRHFFKRLRGGLGGERFPYLWVPEWHKTAHGLHAHFAVGMYVKRTVIEEAWGHGFVHIKRLGQGESRGSVAAARRSAGYLSKYVAKSFEVPRVAGLHRYERAQGFAPAQERFSGMSQRSVLEQAADRMGTWPTRQWDSHDFENWQGPHAIGATWDD